jgi:hypothetical protein
MLKAWQPALEEIFGVEKVAQIKNDLTENYNKLYREISNPNLAC